MEYMGRSKSEDKEKARRARVHHCRHARWPWTRTLRERARERARVLRCDGGMARTRLIVVIVVIVLVA